MIILFTDFGVAGPYIGQMTAVLLREAPGVPVVTLFADAPAHDPRAAAYLLAAYVDEFPPETVFLCVVDPGVGGARSPIVLQADQRWYVGPDNGLFELVTRRALSSARCWDITWRPERLSASFHGRDLFAPIAARLARALPVESPPGAREASVQAIRRPDWPDDLAEAIYVDAFGNVMTGMRASSLPQGARLRISGRTLLRARTFSDVPSGEAFWYENANGLVEIAVNQAHAASLLAMGVGTPLAIEGD